MKIVKQPMFLAGIGAIVLAIAIAIVATVVNPSSAVISKFEKAINKSDAKLLRECISPTLSEEEHLYASAITSMKSLVASLDVTGEIEYQFLVGEEVGVESEDDKDVKTVSGVMVIKSNDKVIFIDENHMQVITIDGKEYLYTGLE